jgi:hypothetical protein
MQTLMNVRAASSMTVLNMLNVLIYEAHTPVVARMDTQTSRRTHSSQEGSAQVSCIKHNEAVFTKYVCLIYVNYNLSL